MGLDMYLNKAKRFNDANLKEIISINCYLQWKEQDNEYSLLEWCGVKEEKINKDLLTLYESEFNTKYYSWDDEKKYGRKSIISYLADWRKANQIHRWFVENVQDGNDDCEIYEVSKEQLEELLTLCKIVLENSKLIDAQVKNGQTYVDGEWVDNYEDGQVIENNVIARKLLPTASGFFFGSTEYDQWYLEDIKHTIAVLEDCLRDTDFEHEVVMYSSSW